MQVPYTDIRLLSPNSNEIGVIGELDASYTRELLAKVDSAGTVQLTCPESYGR